MTVSETHREKILQEQTERWPRSVEAGRKGNPYATLCLHCYGRHKPPLDEICPNAPPPSSTAGEGK